MPEIADVTTLSTITTAWGNSIRSRAIMRYADAAARTASVPSPVNGDLAFLVDTGLVYVYFSGSWRIVGGVAQDMVDGLTGISDTTTASYADMDNVLNLTIPAEWDSWKCAAWCQFRASSAPGTTFDARLRIDGTDQTAVTGLDSLASPVPAYTIIEQRAGMTTTGVRSISLRAKHNGATSVFVQTGTLYAQAWRTS